MGKFRLVTVFALLLISGLGLDGSLRSAVAADDVITFDRSTVTVRTTAEDHVFDVEVARTPHQRTQGLMFRRNMPQKSGMLFLFDRRRNVTMWMKNTYIPLDIIFLNRQGTIVHIAKSTVPHSLDQISSGKPVIAALELNAGATDHFNIRIGDRVHHPFFVVAGQGR